MSLLPLLEVEPDPECRRYFPLPLVPLERFMLLDERAGYPLCAFVQMVFSGRLERGTFREAVRQAVARHPLLLAQVVDHRAGPRWELPERALVACDEQPPAAPFAPPRGAHIQLRSEGGLRLWLQDEGERTTVTFQLHHASSDAQGLRRFAFDLLGEYAKATGDEHQVQQLPIDYARLLSRGSFSAPAASAARSGPSLWTKLRDAWHFHTERPLRLVEPRKLQDAAPLMALPSSSAPGWHKYLFSRDETALVEQHAAAHQVSVNDVAVALLLQTLADWQQAHGRLTRGSLRLMLPVDFRERADRWASAANRISFLFLSRPTSQCRASEPFVSGVAAEIRNLREDRRGLDFLDGIAGLVRMPLLFSWLVQRPACLATAVLSNPGDITRHFRARFPFDDGFPRVGPLRLEEVIGAPPLRPGTRASFGQCIWAGRLTISLQTDSAFFTPAATAALLQSYCSAWRQWAALPTTDQL